MQEPGWGARDAVTAAEGSYLIRFSNSSATVASSARLTPSPTAIRRTVPQRGLPLPFSSRETWLGSSPTRFASALCVSPASVRIFRTAHAIPRCGSFPLATPRKQTRSGLPFL